MDVPRNAILRGIFLLIRFGKNAELIDTYTDRQMIEIAANDDNIVSEILIPLSPPIAFVADYTVAVPNQIVNKYAAPFSPTHLGSAYLEQRYDVDERRARDIYRLVISQAQPNQDIAGDEFVAIYLVRR